MDHHDVFDLGHFGLNGFGLSPSDSSLLQQARIGQAQQALFTNCKVEYSKERHSTPHLHSPVKRWDRRHGKGNVHGHSVLWVTTKRW